MFTNLDLLVIAFMAMASLGLLSMCIMFLVRNVRLKKICFYVTTALSLFAAYAGIQIGWPFFMAKAVMAVILGLVSIGAVVLERKFRGDEKKERLARILAAAALAAGAFNAFV